MSLELRAQTPDEYDGWRRSAVAGYAADFVGSGMLDAQDAARRAEEDFARLLPQGLDTEGHDIFSAVATGLDDRGLVVGSLWLGYLERAKGLEVFIYEIAVDERYRRRGFGRAIMEAAHRVSRDRGAVAVSLNVFGHNAPARALYDSLGYRVVSTGMKLDL